jgi:hypothetical protein
MGMMEMENYFTSKSKSVSSSKHKKVPGNSGDVGMMEMETYFTSKSKSVSRGCS